MELEDFCRQVEEHAEGELEVEPLRAAQAVLAALAGRLEVGQRRELGASLPRQLGRLLASTAAPGHDFDGDAFIEEVAARLDLDDDAAEQAALAVLGAVLNTVRPHSRAEQVLESMPAALSHLMHSCTTTEREREEREEK